MSHVITVDLHVHKHSNDHPYPWRWWVTVDTPYGNYTDEGLAKDEAACDAEFQRHFKDWLTAHKLARQTKGVRSITVDVTDFLEAP